MKKIVASLVFSCLAMFAWAQSDVIRITDNDYFGCDAVMHDNAGGLAPYAPGATDLITICPGGDETQVNLFFLGFDLSVGDTLSIFDGDSDAAPLLYAATGDSLLFATVSPTASNASGCLTVLFVSNGDANVGDFSVRITCGVPCNYPIAVMEGNELNSAPADTVKICPGESVEFDATGSQWTEDATPTYFWDFGDGVTATTTASEDSISHTYPQAGGYRARLRMVDSNNCESLNLPDVIVFVSTPYVFDLTATSTRYCIGSEVLIGTQAFIDSDTSDTSNETDNGNTVTWIEDNSITFDNGIYIPDNQGCLDESFIEFTQFGGVLIDDVSDFNSIYFNMEHSFVGDITIRIICPNGQTMSIFPEAGGSGTYLGEPVDLDNGVPGVGYDYSFSPGSAGGTWMEYLAGGGGGNTIPAGDYEPDGSFEDLIGCPINGTWTLEVCDIVGADDGYVFEFGIEFVATLYPDILTFTPIVGNGCDSSYWVNADVFQTVGENCDWAVFNPTIPGVYTFEYQVVNDFGCVFTDDISIDVVGRPEFVLNDAFICNNATSINLTASSQNISNYNYSWTSLPDELPLSDGDNILNVLLADTGEYSLTVGLNNLANCTRTDTAEVLLIPALSPTSSFNDCDAVLPITLLAAAQDDRVEPYIVYSWTKTDDSPTSVGNESSLEVTEDGIYVLTLNDIACGTSQTATFHIAPPLLITDSLFTPCIEQLPLEFLAEDQGQDVIWTWSYFAEPGSGYTDTVNFLVDTEGLTYYSLEGPGLYTIHVEQQACFNEGTIDITFKPEFCPVLIPNIMTPNGDGENDTFNATNIGRLAGSSCQIFNRWGNLVFEDLDYDGAWSATDLPDGVYYYVIGVKRNTGIEYFSGDLTVIR
jgi:gliding motility-associated-like protein